MLKFNKIKRTLLVIPMVFAFFIVQSCVSTISSSSITSYFSEEDEDLLSIPVKEYYPFLKTVVNKLNLQENDQKQILSILKRTDNILGGISYSQNSEELEMEYEFVMIGNFPRYFTNKALSSNNSLVKKTFKDLDYFQTKKELIIFPITNQIVFIGKSLDGFVTNFLSNNAGNDLFKDEIFEKRNTSIIAVINNLTNNKINPFSNQLQIGIEKLAYTINKSDDEQYYSEIIIKVSDKKVVKIVSLLVRKIFGASEIKMIDDVTILIPNILNSDKFLINLLNHFMEDENGF